MHEIEIPEIKKRLYLPSDLSECDARQYAGISNLLYKYQIGEIDYNVLRVRAVYVLLDMKHKEGSLEDEEYKMGNIYQVSLLLDSFFEDVEGKKVIKQYYVNNPIQKVGYFGKTFYGPTDEFQNVKFGEYVDALHYFTEYNETKDTEYLYLLMATLYRKGNNYKLAMKKPDVRVFYEESEVLHKIKYFKKLDFGQVYGFYLLFASFQKYMCSAKIYYQGQELDLSILFAPDKSAFKSDIPGLGMKTTLYTIAESGVFGSIKDLKKESLWEILLRMYDLTKRDKDFIAQQKTK